MAAKISSVRSSGIFPLKLLILVRMFDMPPITEANCSSNFPIPPLTPGRIVLIVSTIRAGLMATVSFTSPSCILRFLTISKIELSGSVPLI